jgi:membrane-bound metal-dependent hydrolase YbcI (DUF457 family)
VVAASRKKLLLSQDWKVLLLGAFLANCPDFDFFLVWFLQLEGYHRGSSHSLGFGLGVGLLTAALLRPRSLREGLVYGFATFSHSLLDYLTTGPGGGGLKLLWPFSAGRFRLGLFDYFGLVRDPRAVGVGQFLVEMCKAGLVELVIFGPLFLTLLWVKGRGQLVMEAEQA